MSGDVRVNAIRSPAAQIRLRAIQAEGRWLGMLAPPPESMSLWLWLCDHKHRDELDALGCADREQRRLAVLDES